MHKRQQRNGFIKAKEFFQFEGNYEPIRLTPWLDVYTGSQHGRSVLLRHYHHLPKGTLLKEKVRTECLLKKGYHLGAGENSEPVIFQVKRSAWVLVSMPEGRQASVLDTPILGSGYAQSQKALDGITKCNTSHPDYALSAIQNLLHGSGNKFSLSERVSIQKALYKVESMRSHVGFAKREQLVLHAPGGIRGFYINGTDLSVDTTLVGVGNFDIDLGHMLLSIGEKHAKEASDFLREYLRSGGKPFTLVELSLGMCVAAIYNALLASEPTPDLLPKWVIPLLTNRMFESDILKCAYPYYITGY